VGRPARIAVPAAPARPAAAAPGGREQAAALGVGNPLALPVVHLGHDQIRVCQHASIVGR
jgi:hypothetical protein